MSLLLLIVLVLFLVGGLPRWGYHSYGYIPSSFAGVVLVVVLVMFASVNERKTAMGGRNERAKTERKVQEEEPKTAESVFRSEPKGKPIYFSCAGRPRDLKKSEITLHNVKDS